MNVEKVRQAISRGFHGDAIADTIRLLTVEIRATNTPIVPYVLQSILADVSRTWIEEKPLPTETLTRIQDKLTGPCLALIDSLESNGDLLPALNRLVEQYMELQAELAPPA